MKLTAKSRKRRVRAGTVKLRTNGKNKVDADSTVNAPIPYALQRILRPQSQYRWLYPALAAITPQYIETTLNGAMAGYNVQQWWLFDLMLKTWPELLACYTELVQGVMRKKIIFEPYCEEDEKPSDSAIEKSKLISTALRRMQPDAERDDSALEGTVEDLLDGLFRGITVQEVIWQTVDDKQVGTIWAPKATFFVDPTNYAFDVTGALGLRPDKEKPGGFPYSTTGAQPQPSQLIRFPDYKFLIAMHKSSAGNVLGGPLLRPLAWWWCAANFSSDWLLNLAQVFGLPFRWANYDANAPQATVDRICNMLQNMGSAGWAAFPIPTTLEMITPSAAQGSDHSPQGELLDRADRYARLLILGQTMTGTHGTLGKGGGQAFGEVEKTVKDDRIEAAGKFATDVINQQLVPSILMLNYGDTEEMPMMRFLEDKEAGLNEAQRDKTLADTGLEIGVDYLRKKYDIPEPAEGEDTIGGEKPMPMGFGQDFGGSSDGTGADTTGEPPDVKAGCVELELLICEEAGHDFRGNQYTGGKPGAHMEKILTDAGISFKHVDVYGSQIVVTLASEEQARKTSDLLGKAFHIRGVLKTIDDAKVNKNTVLLPSKVTVWRVYATTKKAVAASDQTGHPFRGNQYVTLGTYVNTPHGHGVVVATPAGSDSAYVSVNGVIKKVKKSDLTKIPHDTSNFPSLLQSEENKRRAQLNAKLLELNAIEDDAVFSRELLALTEEIK